MNGQNVGKAQFKHFNTTACCVFYSKTKYSVSCIKGDETLLKR